MFSLPLHVAHPRSTAAALAAGALLAISGGAAAQDRLPPNNGGLQQYVAPQPDAGGDKPADPGEPGRRESLPPNVRAQLPPGAEGSLLERFATSPGYGAPARGTGERGSSGGGDDGGGGGSAGGGGGAGGDGGSTGAREEGGSAVSAVVDTASDSGSLGLVAALVALTLGAVALGRTRRRRT